MNALRLSIRYSPSPVRKSAAWFVAGRGAAEWLAEFRQWEVPLGDLMLYPVPASPCDRTPVGALVIVRGADDVVSSLRAVPYGCIAERLYVPVNALVWPPATEHELASLIGTGWDACVWHPVSGLVGFEVGEGVRVTALLELPKRRDPDWGHARPGIALNTRLRSVEPDRQPTIEAIISEGRDDIGSEAANLQGEPDAPGESPFSRLMQYGARAAAAAANAGMWLVNQLPKTASSRTWADRLGEWLSRVAKSAGQRVDYESERARELRRLLHLLATDPDRGLKFALPLGGDTHRGQAPPSGQLAERDVNFDLSRLGGGGPADFWNVPPQLQYDLIREYRRLAERELHLGRYRRAAYIFAELLNDLPAAAATLASGGHYREAAVLYRDRLKQPLEAARCLERGGLWHEALWLFEELREFEKAGDLAHKLDQPDDGERLYRLELDRILQRDDYLGAAKLLERKLNVPDEALEQLLRGWSSLHQHRQCVAATFRLLGRLGRHEVACQQLARCTAATASTFLYADSAGELADVARTYPDETVRSTAADTVRMLAASRVVQAAPDERRLLLDAVAALAPEDRLLLRDCRRFLERRPHADRKPPRSSSKPVREAELLREILLPPHINWAVVRSTETSFYAAGFDLRTLSIVQGNWNDRAAKCRTFWSLEARDIDRPIVLEPDPHENYSLYVHLPGGPALAPQSLRFGRDEQGEMAFTPPWATPETLALTRVPYGVTWAISRSAGGLALAAYNARHRPVASRLIEIPEQLAATIDDFPVFLQVRDQRVYVGLCDRLIVAREQGDNETVELPGILRGLACSAAHSRRRIAVTYDAGGQIFWDDVFGDHHEWFATTLESPLVEFTASGLLIAAAAGECQIYSTSDRRVRLAAECRWKECRPIGVLRTGEADEFAVCFADGRILVYRVVT